MTLLWVEQSLEVSILLSAFSNSFYRRYWSSSGSVWLLRLAFRYFFLLGSFSIQLNSIILISIRLLTWRRLYYLRWLLPHTLYYCLSQTLALVKTYLSALSLYCLISEVIRGTYCRFSTLLVVSTCTFAFQLGIAFEKAQKLWLQVLFPLCLDMLTVKPDLLTWCIVLRFYFLIICSLLEILGI